MDYSQELDINLFRQNINNSQQDIDGDVMIAYVLSSSRLSVHPSNVC